MDLKKIITNINNIKKNKEISIYLNIIFFIIFFLFLLFVFLKGKYSSTSTNFYKSTDIRMKPLELIQFSILLFLPIYGLYKKQNWAILYSIFLNTLSSFPLLIYGIVVTFGILKEGVSADPNFNKKTYTYFFSFIIIYIIISIILTINLIRYLIYKWKNMT